MPNYFMIPGSKKCVPESFGFNLFQSYNAEPKLLSALISAYWKQFFLAAVFKIGNDAFIFSGPVLLEFIVKFVNDPEQSTWVGK